MKILVVGASINLGSGAWPAQLQKTIDCEIINLSIVGAGNAYIHDTTILELSQRQYDLVIPVWNNFKWVDFRNSQHQQHLDPLNNLNPHKHLISTNWLGSHTRLVNDQSHNQKELLYSTYHYFYDNHAKIESTLLNIVSLQGVLKSRNIPYIFSFYKKLRQLKRFEHLYNLIDFSNVHDKNLYNIARENDWWDGKHPTGNAQKFYADTIADRINTMNLITP